VVQERIYPCVCQTHSERCTQVALLICIWSVPSLILCPEIFLSSNGNSLNEVKATIVIFATYRWHLTFQLTLVNLLCREIVLKIFLYTLGYVPVSATDAFFLRFRIFLKSNYIIANISRNRQLEYYPLLSARKSYSSYPHTWSWENNLKQKCFWYIFLGHPIQILVRMTTSFIAVFRDFLSPPRQMGKFFLTFPLQYIATLLSDDKRVLVDNWIYWTLRQLLTTLHITITHRLVLSVTLLGNGF
jgi:hypothetical protein